jgi:alpha-beta hydrolase superfamily lysophospholipase
MGWLESWETVADSITAQVESALQTYPGYTLVVTGHSLGGAIAAIGATALRNAGYTLDLVSLLFSIDIRSNTIAVHLRPAANWQ